MNHSADRDSAQNPPKYQASAPLLELEKKRRRRSAACQTVPSQRGRAHLGANRLSDLSASAVLTGQVKEETSEWRVQLRLAGTLDIRDTTDGGRARRHVAQARPCLLTLTLNARLGGSMVPDGF